MAEEKPVPEQNEITAALSALSNAAAPERDDAATTDAPTPEDAEVVFTPASNAAETSASDEASQVTPPPPPAPEAAVDSYPPPTTAPVAVTVAAAPIASAAAVVPPAPAAKRKKWPWILAICIVAGLILLGGITACTSAMMKAAFHAVQHNERFYEYGDELFNPDAQDGLWNYYYSGFDATFEDLLDIFNVEEGEITSTGIYARGGYRVGGEDGIEPGLYYLEGAKNGVSEFFIFSPDEKVKEVRYGVRVSGEYFGNYYADLTEGDVVIYIPFDKNSTMFLASEEPMDVMPPYQSGCYRVGIDIPAGTYTITCNVEEARLTDSEAGAFIMDDVDFDEGFASESVYVIKGGRQTISVEDGQYLELFAAIATPATASTKVPLQHIENEVFHVA